MTDNAIIEVSNESLLAELGGLGPKPAVSNRLTLASVRIQQAMSDVVKEGKAKAGDFAITFGSNSVEEPIYTSRLRVMSIDAILGRVMWKLKPDGSKDMSAKEPLCASNNAEQPRLGEHFGYVGKTYSDWRPNKDGEVAEWTITESCKDCPFQQFIPAYVFKKGELVVDEKGKAVTEKNSDGKPRMLRPPCQLTENHVVYLVDYGIPAIIRASSPTVRIALKKLPDYFAEGAGGKRAFIRDGAPHAVVLTTAVKEYKNNGSGTMVPEMELEAEPLTLEQFKAYVDMVKKYDEYNVREALTNPERNDFDRDDEDYEAVDTAVPAASEATKSKLGAGNKRKITAEDREDPFADE